jgi:hypothetical protein
LPPAAAQSQLAGDFDLGNPFSDDEADDSVPPPAIAPAATAAAQAANTDEFGVPVTDWEDLVQMPHVFLKGEHDPLHQLHAAAPAGSMAS